MVGENRKEKKVGENRKEKKVGETRKEKMVGENRKEKKVGKNRKEKKVGETRKESTKRISLSFPTQTVLNELDGLSRDAAVAKYGSVGHAVRVREGAATALHYLRVTKPPSLKCVTSQGSVLSSTNFTDEIDVPDSTNDDKILSCCVHFCSDSTQRRPIRVGVRRLYREVVLLTEDRNLRVKAHARDVPLGKGRMWVT
ncbi:hypothetical protein Pcinc_038944 [Petrolisthes cinctipes]|uniref:PIN domain-containing protein n=1 Tax=Petrolisthes cinctipes TaxID=88211 RepID=A0AAE1EMI6_PETCI|nr:hypothetical protein Pcinc_038944 [Petrolisthes cinctipes]